MELTPEQIKEFEIITDYSQKLKWWQERFEYDLTPRGQNMTIVPQSIEETKLLIDWYEEYFTSINPEFSVIRFKILLQTQLSSLATIEDRINNLSERIKYYDDYWLNNLHIIAIRIGSEFESTSKNSTRDLLDLFISPNIKNVITDFFNGYYIQRLKRYTSEIHSYYSQYHSSNTISNSTIAKKIQWKGTQKELGELLIELKRKDWIDVIHVNTIQSCFTKTHTIGQIIKPTTDTSNYTPTYEAIFTPRYQPKFSKIEENTKLDTLSQIEP